MTDAERKQKMLKGLAAFSLWLASHPEIPMPEDISFVGGELRASYYKYNYEFYPEEVEGESEEDHKQRRAGMAKQWISDITRALIGSGVEIKKDYLGDMFKVRAKNDSFHYMFGVQRESVCIRVVKDVKIHPAVVVPEHTEPERKEEIVEWVCNDGSLLAD